MLLLLATKSVNLKTIERHLQKKEYIKVIQLIGAQYETTEEYFLLVEANLGLGRFDIAEKMLISWQSKLLNAQEWASWCYLYAKCLVGMKNKLDALTTLNFAKDFLKVIDDENLKNKIDVLKKEIEEQFS